MKGGFLERALHLEEELQAAESKLREGLLVLQARLKVLVFERERLRWSDRILRKQIVALEKLLLPQLHDHAPDS